MPVAQAKKQESPQWVPPAPVLQGPCPGKGSWLFTGQLFGLASWAYREMGHLHSDRRAIPTEGSQWTGNWWPGWLHVCLLLPNSGPQQLVTGELPAGDPISMFASRGASCGSPLCRCQQVAHLRAGAGAKDPVPCNILRKCLEPGRGNKQGAASVEPQPRPDLEAAPEQAPLLGVRPASRRRSQQASV